jgi:hypothetical protein
MSRSFTGWESKVRYADVSKPTRSNLAVPSANIANLLSRSSWSNALIILSDRGTLRIDKNHTPCGSSF